MLPFSSHKIFLEKDNTAWVRTGTDGDGNCFFHSYVYSVEPNTFRELDIHQRKSRILKVKKYVADRVTFDDVYDLVHPDAFEKISEIINQRVAPLSIPDLKNKPPLSLRQYIELIYDTHPILRKNDDFYKKIYPILQHYYNFIVDYIKQDGTWMYDALFPIIMKKLNINIIFISHDTSKKITHYPTYNCKYTIYIYHITNHYESIGLYKDGCMHRVFEKDEF